MGFRNASRRLSRPTMQILLMVLFFFHVVASRVEETAKSKKVQSIRDLQLEEFGLSNRVDSIDNTALDCSLGTSTSDSPFVPQTVEYYYGVESTSTDVAGFMEKLDKVIFDSISLWCYENTVNVGTVMIGGGGRKLHSDENPLRQLGILSTASGPVDADFGLTCDYELENSANTCIVAKGGLSLVARETDNLDFTMAAIRDTIQYNMLSDAYLGSKIPSVVRLTYLGDTSGDVVNRGGFDLSGAPGKDDSNLKTVLPVTFSAAAVGAALIFFAVRKRRAVVTKNRGGALFALDAFNGDTRLVGTGDPPGSFHHGLYHYMRNGQSYLSTNCATCYDTRQEGFGILPSIPEGDEEDSVLSRADSKNLGKRHRGIDVHECSSATCKICLNTSKINTTFTPSTKMKSLLGTEEEIESGASEDVPSGSSLSRDSSSFYTQEGEV